MLTIVVAAALLCLAVVAVWVSYGWAPALALWGAGLVIGLCIVLLQVNSKKRRFRTEDDTSAPKKPR